MIVESVARHDETLIEAGYIRDEALDKTLDPNTQSPFVVRHWKVSVVSYSTSK